MKPLLTVAAVMLATSVAAAQGVEPPRRTPFDAGSIALSAGGGTRLAFGYRYIALGAGVGYYVLDGVELGLAGQLNFGDGPSISLLSPSLSYVAQPLVGKWPVVPYVGAFYNHWFIGSGYRDGDAIGGRAGLMYAAGRVVIGLGIAYERIVSECTDCDDVYPDFTLAFVL